MKTLHRLSLRLYPPWWRRRYGREFEALLEDLEPGWLELADTAKGALIMRMRTLATVPVASMLTGALIGAVIAWQAPVMYASSATIQLPPDAPGTDGARQSRDRFLSLESALGKSEVSKPRTRIMVLASRDGNDATLTVTYEDRNPAEARRVTERLATAITTELASAAIVSAAEIPTTPVRRKVACNMAYGSAGGLTAGTLALLAVRVRRRKTPDAR